MEAGRTNTDGHRLAHVDVIKTKGRLRIVILNLEVVLGVTGDVGCRETVVVK